MYMRVYIYIYIYMYTHVYIYLSIRTPGRPAATPRQIGRRLRRDLLILS